MTTQQEKIRVRQVFTPDGKGPAALIDTNGKKWKFWTGGKFGGIPVSRFAQDQEYTIGFKVKPYDGKDEFYITEVLDGVHAPPVMSRPSAPPPRARTNPTDSEQIFVMCMVKERPIFKGGDATATDLIAEINMLRDVYRNTFGGNAQQDDQMNDQIPHL